MELPAYDQAFGKQEERLAGSETAVAKPFEKAITGEGYAR